MSTGSYILQFAANIHNDLRFMAHSEKILLVLNGQRTVTAPMVESWVSGDHSAHSANSICTFCSLFHELNGKSSSKKISRFHGSLRIPYGSLHATYTATSILVSILLRHIFNRRMSHVHRLPFCSWLRHELIGLIIHVLSNKHMISG